MIHHLCLRFSLIEPRSVSLLRHLMVESPPLTSLILQPRSSQRLGALKLRTTIEAVDVASVTTSTQRHQLAAPTTIVQPVTSLIL